MSESGGYILRIGDEKWVKRVFDMAIYYTNLNRKWSSGETVLFIHKTLEGDAFVGYGVIAQARQKDHLSDEDRAECERGGWKRAIEFQYVIRFEEPLLIRETVLANSRLRGRFFHGLRLQSGQLQAILRQAESLRSHQKS